MNEGEELDLLVQAARGGDAAAYRRLLALASDRLRGFFLRRLAERADAEDLVQECLIAMHARLDSHDPARPAAPWIFAIARYKLVDHFRRSGRRATAVLEERIAGGDDDFARQDIESLLAELPGTQAQAIRLSKIEGYSTAEVAEATGSGISAVKVRIHRGLTRLKAMVAEKES